MYYAHFDTEKNQNELKYFAYRTTMYCAVCRNTATHLALAKQS